MLHHHEHIDKLHNKTKKKPKHYLVLVSSVMFPLSTFPQIIEIFSNESALNVSLLTYVLYLIFAFIFLGYGINEKLKPIIVLQSLWLVMYCFVILGIFLHG